MRDTLRLVVATSLSGSWASFSLTENVKKHFKTMGKTKKAKYRPKYAFDNCTYETPLRQ